MSLVRKPMVEAARGLMCIIVHSSSLDKEKKKALAEAVSRQEELASKCEDAYCEHQKVEQEAEILRKELEFFEERSKKWEEHLRKELTHAELRRHQAGNGSWSCHGIPSSDASRALSKAFDERRFKDLYGYEHSGAHGTFVVKYDTDLTETQRALRDKVQDLLRQIENEKAKRLSPEKRQKLTEVESKLDTCRARRNSIEAEWERTKQLLSLHLTELPPDQKAEAETLQAISEAMKFAAQHMLPCEPELTRLEQLMSQLQDEVAGEPPPATAHVIKLVDKVHNAAVCHTSRATLLKLLGAAALNQLLMPPQDPRKQGGLLQSDERDHPEQFLSLE
eukprot:TRINITY_DN100432_c0_g1_i1.p1 TRINITY_DN100432_c0_g1~~TRINITY_DN100432_c0_g1_i1.p1  ORF type:complete len:335 (+),score=94.10 TRINITY_DN100432_c0_g1_i1:270-1274(+)